MGLDFTKTSQDNVAGGVSVSDTKNEIEVVESYDIVADRQQMNETLVNSEEVDRIVSTIEVNNLDTIVSFGAPVAEEISKASDVVLNSMNMSQLDDTSAMLNTLAKIMDQFDIEELKENKGLFNKLFGNLKKQLDKILAKYHTMGDEVDKIYVQLKQYESEIKQANHKLDQMFEANVNYYHELVRYILAGEQACKEIEEYIAKRQDDMAKAVSSYIVEMYEQGYENIAVLCKSSDECVSVRSSLTLPLSDENSVNLKVLPVYLAKGLEFDAVALWGIEKEKYSGDNDKNILYTAVTRAMHNVKLFFVKELPEFLQFVNIKLL